ncbi:hypothetical protein F2Q70_00040606 [Brassica cretica]|uniref:Uncharacterized protein n=2 Tax=Brassica cretica TaxID=69181 RepID=A0A8S9MMK9_BRACR|nr:hypothetical protein F2Q70_00040606 [Brassica cretica]KAF2618646.1 hypothetical protein F2Q68_00041280 [Brassica cretica]KAF3493640.1 hypothetical protein DY000_02055746 [Brassica cretica]
MHGRSSNDDDDDAVDSSVTLCLLWELAVTALPVRSTGDFTMPSGNLDGREIRDG